MRKYAIAIITVVLSAALAAAAQGAPGAAAHKVFPYAYTIDDLPNGLRVITVPTDYPNLVALYTVVQAGSRNEVEPGKSGFAHLFEHLMFRGSKNFTPEQRDQILKRAGASTNAYTTDDRTVYHEVFAKEDLEKVLELEADRFQGLQYAEDVFKTETRAVLGEYNKNSSNPLRMLHEKLRETAFHAHTYSHTTMGFLRDIEDMPSQYRYSLEFYQRYYRPEYTTMILAGDLNRAKALELVKKYFGGWERGDYQAAVPAEPAQESAREAHIDWPSPTLPWVAVAFHAPAYSDTDKNSAALDLLAAMAFGENSELYQKLVLKEQKVAELEAEVPDHVDPELFVCYAQVKDAKDVEYVREQVLATYRQFAETPVTQARLEATRSRLRYQFALSMDSSEAIAENLAPFVGLRRTPETINRRYALYEQVSPEDVAQAGRQYFGDQNRTIVTLSTHTDSGRPGSGGAASGSAKGGR